jgi:hypothetical protein
MLAKKLNDVKIIKKTNPALGPSSAFKVFSKSKGDESVIFSSDPSACS